MQMIDIDHSMEIGADARNMTKKLGEKRTTYKKQNRNASIGSHLSFTNTKLAYEQIKNRDTSGELWSHQIFKFF